MKKLILFVLALILCLSFAACGDDVSETTEIPADTTEAAGEMPDIPLTADYGGYEFNILASGNQVFNDFDFEEDSSLPLDSAQYKRKLKVEQDYNIKIYEDRETATSFGSGPGYTQVSKQVNSGDTEYDLCLIAGYDVAVLAYGGYLYDINSIDKIGLEKSWWDQNAAESLEVKDVLFFTTGDITVSDDRCAYALIFNKSLLAEYQLESPYDLVDNGEWTIEKFGTMCKAVSEDLNQDGEYDQNDRFGLLVWDDSILGIINAVGERCCTINDEGIIELTLYNEKTLSAFEQYVDIAYDTQSAFTYQRYIPSGLDMWLNDQALFWTSLVDYIPNFREMESDFGILPYPKLDVQQENHYSAISAYSSQFICVPLVQEDIDRTGAITELLAYHGQKMVKPALFDVVLIGQGMRDVESEAMLDIIFDNIVYDIGYYYRVGNFGENIMGLLRKFNTNFTSMYDTYSISANAVLKIVNQSYSDAVEEWK